MKVYISMILLFLFTQSTTAFPGNIPNERGIGLALTDKGAGARYAYSWNHNKHSYYSMDIELVSVNGPFEVPIVDPFTGITFKLFNENLLLLPLMIGYRKMLFVDKIADNLKPYVQLSAGPVMAFDMIEINREGNTAGFIEQFSKGKAYYTIGARLNVGATIKTSKNNFINASLGYSIIDFGKVLDNRVAFGGVAIRVELGRWIR